MASRFRVGLRAVVVGLGITLAAVALLTTRVVWSSYEELETGLAAAQADQGLKAIQHLRQAAHYYAPGNPYVVAALDELRRIGREAEMEGQDELALSAYRAIRASCLGTRSFYIPHERRLEEANSHIAALMARGPRPPMDRGKTVSQVRQEHLDLLSTIEEPHPGWSAVACLSFLTWVGGAFAFVFRGLDEELKLRRGPATRWGIVIAVALAAWVGAMLMA